MVDIKDYVEIFEDIPRMDRMMISFSKYNKSRGGGILWIIIYWALYIFSFYITIQAFSYNYSNILKSFAFLMFIIIGFLFFLITACFLIYGVSHQMSVMNNWHKQQFRDYKNMIEIKVHNVIEKVKHQYPMGNPLWDKDMLDLYNSLQDFESTYFPKK
jgi:hypothetical protein